MVDYGDTSHTETEIIGSLDQGKNYTSEDIDFNFVFKVEAIH